MDLVGVVVSIDDRDHVVRKLVDALFRLLPIVRVAPIRWKTPQLLDNATIMCDLRMAFCMKLPVMPSDLSSSCVS